MLVVDACLALTIRHINKHIKYIETYEELLAKPFFWFP